MGVVAGGYPAVRRGIGDLLCHVLLPLRLPCSSVSNSQLELPCSTSKNHSGMAVVLLRGSQALHFWSITFVARVAAVCPGTRARAQTQLPDVPLLCDSKL